MRSSGLVGHLGLYFPGQVCFPVFFKAQPSTVCLLNSDMEQSLEVAEMSSVDVGPPGVQLQVSGPQTRASVTSAEPPSPVPSSLLSSLLQIMFLLWFAEYAGLFKSINDREKIGIGEESSLGVLGGLPLPLPLAAILKRATRPEYE